MSVFCAGPTQRYNLFENMFYKLANLPHALTNHPTFLNFFGTLQGRTGASNADLYKSFHAQLLDLSGHVICAYDRDSQRHVGLRVELLNHAADTPRQNEFTARPKCRATGLCRHCCITTSQWKAGTLECQMRNVGDMKAARINMFGSTSKQARKKFATANGLDCNKEAGEALFVDDPLPGLDPYSVWVSSIDALHEFALGLLRNLTSTSHKLATSRPPKTAPNQQGNGPADAAPAEVDSNEATASLTDPMVKRRLGAWLDGTNWNGVKQRTYSAQLPYMGSWRAKEFKYFAQMAVPFYRQAGRRDTRFEEQMRLLECIISIMTLALAPSWTLASLTELDRLVHVFLPLLRRYDPKYYGTHSKVHYLVHITGAMLGLGPMSVFFVEAEEFHNGTVRRQLLSSNRLHASADVLRHFLDFQFMFHAAGDVRGRVGGALQSLLNEDHIQETFFHLSKKFRQTWRDNAEKLPTCKNMRYRDSAGKTQETLKIDLACVPRGGDELSAVLAHLRTNAILMNLSSQRIVVSRFGRLSWAGGNSIDACRTNADVKTTFGQRAVAAIWVSQRQSGGPHVTILAVFRQGYQIKDAQGGLYHVLELSPCKPHMTLWANAYPVIEVTDGPPIFAYIGRVLGGAHLIHHCTLAGCRAVPASGAREQGLEPLHMVEGERRAVPDSRIVMAHCPSDTYLLNIHHHEFGGRALQLAQTLRTTYPYANVTATPHTLQVQGLANFDLQGALEEDIQHGVSVELGEDQTESEDEGSVELNMDINGGSDTDGDNGSDDNDF